MSLRTTISPLLVVIVCAFIAFQKSQSASNPGIKPFLLVQKDQKFQGETLISEDLLTVGVRADGASAESRTRSLAGNVQKSFVMRKIFDPAQATLTSYHPELNLRSTLRVNPTQHAARYRPRPECQSPSANAIEPDPAFAALSSLQGIQVTAVARRIEWPDRIIEFHQLQAPELNCAVLQSLTRVTGKSAGASSGTHRIELVSFQFIEPPPNLFEIPADAAEVSLSELGAAQQNRLGIPSTCQDCYTPAQEHLDRVYQRVPLR